MELQGTRALVTGATGGIGGAVVRALAGQGSHVLASGRDPGRLAALAGVCADTCVADLLDAGDAERLLAACRGGLQLAVLAAGVGAHGTLAQTSDEAVDALLEVNLRAQARLLRAVVPLLAASGPPARVVLVGSVAGALGVPGEAAYAASKAAAMVLAESVRGELRRDGVGVTVLVPGAVATGFYDRRGAAYDRVLPRPVPPRRVAAALVRGLRRDAEEVVVPGWLRAPMALRALAPQTYRRLAARWG